MTGWRRTFRSLLLDDGSAFTVTYWKPPSRPPVVRKPGRPPKAPKAPQLRPPMPRYRGRTICPTSGKLRYGSQQVAERALAKAATNLQRLEFRSYECKDCGAWHLTSKPKRGRA